MPTAPLTLPPSTPAKPKLSLGRGADRAALLPVTFPHGSTKPSFLFVLPPSTCLPQLRCRSNLPTLHQNQFQHKSEPWPNTYRTSSVTPPPHQSTHNVSPPSSSFPLHPELRPSTSTRWQSFPIGSGRIPPSASFRCPPPTYSLPLNAIYSSWLFPLAPAPPAFCSLRGPPVEVM